MTTKQAYIQISMIQAVKGIDGVFGFVRGFSQMVSEKVWDNLSEKVYDYHGLTIRFRLIGSEVQSMQLPSMWA